MTGDRARREAISDVDRSEPRSTAFWSYVRRDNEILFGKLDHLRVDLQGIYAIETGNALDVLIDHEIGWGKQWESVLDEYIERATFLIPVITARYFASEYCRSELLRFSAGCEARGLGNNLILPIVISGRHLISLDSDDVVSKIIAGTQYVDFTEVWPMDRSGEAWLLAVRRMVHKLIDAESRAEDLLAATSYGDGLAGPGSSAASDREPEANLLVELDVALNDVFSAMEDAVGALHGLVRVMHEQAVVSPHAARSVTSRGGAAQTAEALRAPARDFESAAAQALETVRRADLVIARVSRSIDEISDLSLFRRAEKIFAETVGDLPAVAAAESQLAELLDVVAEVERRGVVIRRSLRAARRGFQFLRDAARLMLGWRSGNFELTIDVEPSDG